MGEGEKLVAQNRKARFNYEFLEKLEAGIVLTGTEVKALREGRCNLTDGFVDLRRGEAYLVDVNISGYSHGNLNNHDPLRRRKLLLHKREIARWASKIAERGLTCIPLRLYFKEGRAKIEVALARGKRKYDKRQDIKAREANRDAARALKERH